MVCASSSVAINVVATNIRADDYLAELFITRKKETVSIGRFPTSFGKMVDETLKKYP